MGSWGSQNVSSNSVMWSPDLVNKTSNSVNMAALFGNTTSSAFITNANTGVFYAAVNSSVTALKAGVTSQGWVLRKQTNTSSGGVRKRYETLVALAATNGDNTVP